MTGVNYSECNGKKHGIRKESFFRLRSIPAIGILFAVFSAFFNATANLLVKLVDDLHAIEIVVLRSSVQVFCYLSLILITQRSFRAAKGEWFYLLLRCIFGFMAVVSVFISLRMIPLGDSSAILYSAPVFVTVIARIVLKEKCDYVNVIALFVTAGGVILITKPSFLFSGSHGIEDEHRLVGCLLAVSGAFSTALAFVSLRRLQNTPSSVVVFWHSLFAVVLGTIILLFINEIKLDFRAKNMAVIFMMGLCSTFGHLCLTLAFKLEEAGPVSLARTVSIVIAFVYQVFILNEQLGWTSALGASIVLCVVVTVTIRKYYKSSEIKEEESEDIECLIPPNHKC